MTAYDLSRSMIEAAVSARQTPLIVALEGGAASGKTTLARQLAAYFDAPVISMDDFFLPPALRTPQRLREIGGNIHYERFQRQVAGPIRAGEAILYDLYDCREDRLAGTLRIEKSPLLLIEGVYSLHPMYRDIYDFRLFLRADPKTQDARLLARGPWAYRQFQDTWLPLEKAYFDSTDWEALCDAILDT